VVVGLGPKARLRDKATDTTELKYEDVACGPNKVGLGVPADRCRDTSAQNIPVSLISDGSRYGPGGGG
jgi:hypothetical protein